MATFVNDEELTQEIKRQVSETIQPILDKFKAEKSADDKEAKTDDGVSDAVKAYLEGKGKFKGKIEDDNIKHYLRGISGETEEDTLQNLDGVSPAVLSYLNGKSNGDKFKGKEI